MIKNLQCKIRLNGIQGNNLNRNMFNFPRMNENKNCKNFQTNSRSSFHRNSVLYNHERKA